MIDIFDMITLLAQIFAMHISLARFSATDTTVVFLAENFSAAPEFEAARFTGVEADFRRISKLNAWKQEVRT